MNTDLDVAVADQGIRLTSAEENIQGNCSYTKKLKKVLNCTVYILSMSKQNRFLGLQMTDVELDERVTALEEGGGGGRPQNGNKVVI